MDPGLHPFAWCGWRLDVPADWRPFMTDGDTRSGAFGLADEEQRRLVVRWRFTGRRKPPARRRLIAPLLHNLPRPRVRALRKSIAALTSTSLPIAFVLRDEEARATRIVGWSSISGRMVNVLYRHGTPRQDSQFEGTVLASLVDQPADQPQRWAFFGVSFIAPAGMIYQSSELKVGDMRMALARPRSRRRRINRAEIIARVIYPAELALRRMPMDQWLAMVLNDTRRLYRPPRAVAADATPLHTAWGEGLVCDAPLRRRLRWTRWAQPFLLRSRLIHDTGRNRLILLQAFAHPNEADPLLDALTAGFHWAERSST